MSLIARTVLWIDRWVLRFIRAWSVVRDELLGCFLSHREKNNITAKAYSGQTQYYSPHGEIGRQRLFDWEKRILSSPYFPRSGVVLVGACGAGREVAGLTELGYRAVGFDSSDAMVAEARRSVRSSSLYQGTYEDFIDAVENRSGPLQAVMETGSPYDAIVLGWGSFSHVLGKERRLALMRASRKVAPHAPVVMSFSLRSPVSDSFRIAMIRKVVRRSISLLGGRLAEEGDVYWRPVGFSHQFLWDEIEGLAREAGYEIVDSDRALFPQPYAVLCPTDVCPPTANR